MFPSRDPHPTVERVAHLCTLQRRDPRAALRRAPAARVFFDLRLRRCSLLVVCLVLALGLVALVFSCASVGFVFFLGGQPFTCCEECSLYSASHTLPTSWTFVQHRRRAAGTSFDSWCTPGCVLIGLRAVVDSAEMPLARVSR